MGLEWFRSKCSLNLHWLHTHSFVPGFIIQLLHLTAGKPFPNARWQQVVHPDRRPLPLSHFSPLIGTWVLPSRLSRCLGSKIWKAMANPLSLENNYFGTSLHDACSEITHVCSNAFQSCSCSDWPSTNISSDSIIYRKFDHSSTTSLTYTPLSSHAVKVCFHQQVAKLLILPVVSARVQIYKESLHSARWNHVISPSKLVRCFFLVQLQL
jgi:hypothetical protein